MKNIILITQEVIRWHDKAVIWAGDNILCLYISGGYTSVFTHRVHQVLHLSLMHFTIHSL